MNKKLRLKMLSIFGCFILGIGLLTACGGGAAPTTTPTTTPAPVLDTTPVVTTPTSEKVTFPVLPDETLLENPASNGTVTLFAEEKVVVCSADKLNVRVGPDTEYSIIAQLMKGMEVTVIGETSNGWYQLKEGKYYASKEFLKDK